MKNPENEAAAYYIRDIEKRKAVKSEMGNVMKEGT
jgi:hypothetical protein